MSIDEQDKSAAATLTSSQNVLRVCLYEGGSGVQVSADGYVCVPVSGYCMTICYVYDPAP